MPTALVSKQFIAGYGDQIKAVAAGAGKSVQFITLPEQQGARLPQADCDRIDCTFLDRDINFTEHLAAAFREAVAASRSVQWLVPGGSWLWLHARLGPVINCQFLNFERR